MKKSLFFIALFFVGQVCSSSKHAVDLGLGFQNDMLGVKYSYSIDFNDFILSPFVSIGAVGIAMSMDSDIETNRFIPSMGLMFGKSFSSDSRWGLELGMFSYKGEGSPKGQPDLTEWTTEESCVYIGVNWLKNISETNWFYRLGLDVGLRQTQTAERGVGNVIVYNDPVREPALFPVATIGRWF